MKRFTIFAAFLATVGFTLGTFTLLGPVRWMTDSVRAKGWPKESEDLLVRGVIIVLMICSALLAAWLSGIVTPMDMKASSIVPKARAHAFSIEESSAAFLIAPSSAT